MDGTLQVRPWFFAPIRTKYVITSYSIHYTKLYDISVEDLEQMSVDAYDVAVENLTSKDASAFIRNLQQAA